MSDTPKSAAPTLPPPGWYEDPMDAAFERWWTGVDWTDHLLDPKTGVAPVAGTPVPLTSTHLTSTHLTSTHSAVIGGVLQAAAEPEVEPDLAISAEERAYVPMADYTADSWKSAVPMNSPAGSGYTYAIWLLAASPIFYFILVFAEYGLQLTAVPSLQASLATIIFGLAVIGINFLVWVLLAIWDYVTLKKRGLPAPNPVWMLLTILAYFIARRIVLKRVGVRSNAPGNVYVLLLVAGSVSSALFATTILAHQRDVQAIHHLEQYAEQQLHDGTHAAWTVDCPDDAPASTVGATFKCVATDLHGVKASFAVEVTDPDSFKITVDPDQQTGGTS
jgi:Protein of unknown function (DUF2510)